MSTKERYQNPVVGDDVKLRLFVYNSNNFADINTINYIDIYRVNSTSSDITNPNEGYLVERIKGEDVTKESIGKYLLDLTTSAPAYTIGYYFDIWNVIFENEEAPANVTNVFQIYPDLFYTAPIPLVYDFSFQFRPNRLRKGSKQYLIAQITPNVPKGTDLQRYYENLAIRGNLKISIEQRTGTCLPCETDLRMVVEKANMDYREKLYGYYMLDTTDLDIAIYDVWFELDFGDSVYISDRQSLQIYN
jgi:hypothetical protein